MVRWRSVGHTTHTAACAGGLEHDGKAAAGGGHPLRAVASRGTRQEAGAPGHDPLHDHR